MTSVQERKDKKFSWTLYGFSIFLCIVFITTIVKIFFLPTTPSSSSEPQCPQMFQKYENSVYSICYPKGWTAHNEQDITYADGSVSQHVVSFTNSTQTNEHIQVIPNRGVLAGQSRCLQQDNLDLNGYPVLRLTYRDATNKDSCGEIVSYTSVFQTSLTASAYKKGIVIDYVTDKGVNLTPDQYFAIEDSLRIVNN